MRFAVPYSLTDSAKSATAPLRTSAIAVAGRNEAGYETLCINDRAINDALSGLRTSARSVTRLFVHGAVSALAPLAIVQILSCRGGDDHR
jgi:hypothetical protein